MINVDKIVTISLKDNHSRQSSAKLEIAKLGLNTDFFLAERDTGHEERGCFDSHQQVSNNALAEKLQYVLIFEDDVKLLPFTPTQIQQINAFLTNKTNDFDILYLGLIIGKMWFTGSKHIVRATGAGAHAYILSQRGMKKFALYQYDGIPVDKIFKHDFTCYSVFPIIAEQFPEEILESALTPSRSTTETLKDKTFWCRNFERQKGILRKNLLKTISYYFKKLK